MYDLIISDGNLWKKGRKSIAIKGGMIEKISETVADAALRTVDARGMTIFPGFVDLHTHPDKAMSFRRVENPSGTLLEAIVNMNRYFETASVEDIAERATAMATMALSHGTTFMRCHISLEAYTGLRTWEAAVSLRNAFKERMEIQLIAFPGAIKRLEKGGDSWNRLEAAIALGADGVGGCPHLSEDYCHFTDTLFELAEKHSLPLDLHINESEEPEAAELDYLADQTVKRGMEGRVTAGHCTSLSAMEPETALRVIDKVAAAGMHIVTLPSCNLYLMGRQDLKNRRRGTTRIAEFLDAGVNISLASDNIRDPFRPFGNGNLLEEALLCAQVAQLGREADLHSLLNMISCNPARAMGLKHYGLSEGSYADFAIIDSPDPVEALIGQGRCLGTFFRGRQVSGSLQSRGGAEDGPAAPAEATEQG
jgi:cytosine/creatinine deaminase